MVLSVARGYDPNYLLKEVATGRENYYTDAVAEGEPPGRWWGAGTERVGLAGEVDAQDMTALYSRFLDPREEGFRDPERWDEVYTLGHTGRAYKPAEQLYAEALEREPDADAERRDELRTEAGKAERQNVAFLDLTYSVPKSVTVLHTSVEAAEVRARREGRDEEASEWAGMRAEIEGAIWEANNAMLAYMQDHAGYTRVGHHGGAAGRWRDAHTWIVASFFQHDSRDHDPQLHIHNSTLNRVEDADGVWRTIDSRAVYRWKRAGGAVADRTLDELMIDRFGVEVAMRPDGKAREITLVPVEGREMFSSRSGKITPRVAEMVTAYEARVGRTATGAEVDRIKREATTATRSAKTHTGETREQGLDRMAAQADAEIKGGMAGIAHAAREVYRARQTERATEAAAAAQGATAASAASAGRGRGERFEPEHLITDAVEAIQSKKATFGRPDVVAVLNDLLPDHLGLPDGADVAALLDGLAEQVVSRLEQVEQPAPGDEALPAALRKDDGTSAMEAPGGPVYTTQGQLHRENRLRAATQEHDGDRLTAGQVEAFVERLRSEGIELGVDQAAALTGILTSGARVQTLVGPAGTGKSFVVGSLARAWTDPAHRDHNAHGVPVGAERRVFGLATAQIATDVLAAEGLTASNTAAWLGAQRRLTRTRQPGSSGVDGDEAWRLRRGDIVVVDESSMADLDGLAAIHGFVDAAGANMLMAGDHRQLAAVGAAGTMELAARAGASYELSEARRFVNEWERDASLRLRAGDPTVVAEYHRHGRLLDAGTLADAEASAARAWLADTLGGRRSLLVVDTNDAAARVSESIRAELVRLGRVEERGVELRDRTYAGVGDVVAGRRVAWELAGYEGNRRGPVNRERYRVLAVRDDGGLEVEVLHRGDPLLENPATATATDSTAEPASAAGVRERLVLPPGYVAADTTLAYAATKHAVEGANADTSHTVVTPGSDVNGLYVGGSRGQRENTFHVATRRVVDDRAQGGAAHEVHQDPRAVLGLVLDTREATDTANRSATASVQDAREWARSMQTGAERFADAAHDATVERTARHLDELAAAELLGPVDRARIAAEDGTAALARIVRQAELAGHDPRRVLREAVLDPLDGARQVSDVIRGRIRAHTPSFDPVPATWTRRVPVDISDEYATYLTAIGGPLDGRTAEIGAQVAAEQPAWALHALGPVPPLVLDDGTGPADNTTARAEWEAKAGRIGAHRDLRGLSVTTEPSDIDAADPGSPGTDRRFSRARSGFFDAADLLGSAPLRGQAEAYAAYRDAHRDAGQPDYTRDALEHSPSWHRACIRGWRHEKQWGPPHTDNLLAGTRQAEAHHRGEAELRRAEAHTAQDSGDEETSARLAQEAVNHDALADTLTHTAARLEEAGQERGRFLVRTAMTRAQSDASEAYLAAHGLRPEPEHEVTGEEWLALDRAARAEDDPHRDITDSDLDTHQHDQSSHDKGDTDDESRSDADEHSDAAPTDARRVDADDDALDRTGEEPAADTHRPAAIEDDSDAGRQLEPDNETRAPERRDDEDTSNAEDSRNESDREESQGENSLPDVRELAAIERAGLDEDTVHVPDADETERAVRLAKHADIEWRNRSALEARHEAEEQEAARDTQLARWHTDDHPDEHSSERDTVDEDAGSDAGSDDAWGDEPPF